MDQSLPPRLSAHLESAVHRVRLAARLAAAHTVDSLGLAALANHHGVAQRDALLEAQYELNRKQAAFSEGFEEALDTDVARQTGTLKATPHPFGRTCPTPEQLVSSWDKLALVDDHEVEIHLFADRFARDTSHACEWEIRELDAYMGSLLHLNGSQRDRNPLRAEVVGQAMVRGIERVSERPDLRKLLCSEIGRSLALAMRQTYTDIVTDLREQGIKPLGLTVRQTPTRGPVSVHGPLPTDHDTLQPAPAMSATAQLASLRGTGPGGRSAFAASRHSAFAASLQDTVSYDAGLGQVDADMMALIHQLVGTDSGAAADGADMAGSAADGRVGSAHASATAAGTASGAHPLPNLILAHREALRLASSAPLDHLVIDLVGHLFDQILSDDKVPPQLARQLARLQLPVLRAALGDKRFFTSRRHPVRHFVNRIASLGSAIDDPNSAEGQALLARVAVLVHEVVNGDFEQIALYEHQLDALERFVTEQAQARVQALGQPDRVLARKEDELRVQAQYARELDDALRDLPLPDYLRAFISQVWSRVIAQAALSGQGGDVLAQHLRETGQELAMSVQPKGSPALRQAFVRRLPQLMKDLNQGLDSIHCPEGLRRDFFAKLLPAHADSLKGQPLSTLECNLLSRQLEGALAAPLPQAANLAPTRPSGTAPLPEGLLEQHLFTPAEAHAVGLVDERAVDWNGKLDIDLRAEPELTAMDIGFAGLPTPEAMDPTRGAALADHVQIGFAYRMHLDGIWRKVRLTHVSAGRSFFIFSHGTGQRRMLSMTHRMLKRMCEAGRMSAFENGYLLERATARARRQLAAMTPH